MPQKHAFPLAVLNRCDALDDDQAELITHAVTRQINHDFAPEWGIDAKVNFVPRSSTRGWQGKWNLLLLDDSDSAGALGYHDLTPEGLPVGKVFAGTDLKYGYKPSVTLSHEALEMLGDPNINLTAEDPTRGLFVAYEMCDAVEADEIGYEVDVDGQQVLVSDFVLPPFFDHTAKGREGCRFSFRENIHAPFELAEGGYEAIFVPGKGWTQRTARKGGTRMQDRARVGSRRERRFAASNAEFEPAPEGVPTWERSVP